MTLKSVIFPRPVFSKKSGVWVKLGLRFSLLKHYHPLTEEIPYTPEFGGRWFRICTFFPCLHKYKEIAPIASPACMEGRKKGLWLPSYPTRIMLDARLTSPHPRLTFRQTCSQALAQHPLQGMALNGFGICFVLPRAHILGLLVFIQ